MKPTIQFIDVSKTNIYIRTLLRWTQYDPAIQKNFKDITIPDLAERMSSITEDVQQQWDSKEHQVLEHVSSISGFPWEDIGEETICVYPIPFFHSLSHPLFLKVCDVTDGNIERRSAGLIIGTLIHELTHHLVRGLPVERTVNEALIHFVVLDSLQTFFGDRYASEYEKFYSSLETLNAELVPIPISNKEQTIATFYKRTSPDHWDS